jgi:hypothetical protein
MDVHPPKNVSIGIDPYPCWDLNFFCQPGVFATVPLKDYLFRGLDRGQKLDGSCKGVIAMARSEIPGANGCFYGKSMGKLGKTRYKWRCFYGKFIYKWSFFPASQV